MLKCFSHTRFLGQWEDNKMCEGIVILLNAIIIPQSLGNHHTSEEMNSDFIFYMFSQEVLYEWSPLSFTETKKILKCHGRKGNIIIIRFEYIILNIIDRKIEVFYLSHLMYSYNIKSSVIKSVFRHLNHSLIYYWWCAASILKKAETLSHGR